LARSYDERELVEDEGPDRNVNRRHQMATNVGIALNLEKRH
jgi:hypothetical protein